MTTKNWLEHIENGGCVFSIGQLDKPTLKELNRLTRKSEIARIKTLWPWHTIGVSKTAYCLPGLSQHFECPVK